MSSHKVPEESTVRIRGTDLDVFQNRVSTQLHRQEAEEKRKQQVEEYKKKQAEKYLNRNGKSNERNGMAVNEYNGTGDEELGLYWYGCIIN